MSDPTGKTPARSGSDLVKPKRSGGRKAAFEGTTVKVALFLPPGLAAELRSRSARFSMTPSQVVAHWVNGWMKEGQIVEVQGQQWKLLKEWMLDEWEAERLSDQAPARIQWLNGLWRFFEKP